MTKMAQICKYAYTVNDVAALMAGGAGTVAGRALNKEDPEKGAITGAAAGLIGIPLLMDLPQRNPFAGGLDLAAHAGIGALIGSKLDEENKTRGALLGGATGLFALPYAENAVHSLIRALKRRGGRIK